MFLLYMFLIIFSYQDCSEPKLLAMHDTTFFDFYLFSKYKDSPALLNRSDLLSDDTIKAFDFKEVQNQYEGVIVYSDNKVDFLTRTTAPASSKSMCTCSEKIVPGFKSTCLNCKNFKSKLRNGIFYCGDYRLCRQNEKGDVFIEQYNEDSKKETERHLFTNFKKIIQVETNKDGDIYFCTKENIEPRIFYNYTKDEKRVNNKENVSFSLKEYYTEKYPWMKQELKMSHSIYSLSGDDVLHVEAPIFRYFFTSLFERILFSGIVDVCKKTQNAFLKTNNGKFILYNKNKDSISFIEGTPEYDSYDIDSWLFSKKVSYNPIKESLMGKYFQTGIMKLRILFYNLIINRLSFLF